MTTTASTERGAQAQARPRELLTFRVGHEHYGIDILRVQEIRRYEPATALPQTSPAVKGVVNLRGAVVPIIDLRTRLGMETPTFDEFTVTVILDRGMTRVGMVVDAVSEVVSVSEVKPSPFPEDGSSSHFVEGLAMVGEDMVILLDLERLLDGEAFACAA